MSWLSDLLEKGVNYVTGYDISDSIPSLSSLFGGSGSSSDPSSGGWKTSDYIKLGSDILGVGGQLYQHGQDLGQMSKQWDAQFAYNQQRDAVNDAFNKEKLQAQLQMAGMAAGAQVKAAGLAAAAQNKRTLADEYANWMNNLSQARRDQLQGYQSLGEAMANPYIQRARMK